ncbi:hypothetical protein BAU15_07575 [Enterococcus sp. JM4C]|uniref:hypothetical protein n=1 Tax=Candidatus Enterococcus huntleyi TaxID=1857217 RepID=UPI001F32B3D6|nr:hypothetical protein [Enterococcus sp. JM4C]KAF1297562.1 hypothetical protein BAU15_07575 [Enterococcus sp. JM4C]
MKKTYLLLLLVPFILGACGKTNNTEESSTSNSSVVASSTSTSSNVSSTTKTSETSEKSSESKNSSSTKNSETSSSTNNQTGSEATTDAPAQLVSAYPEVLLPTTVPINEGAYLNVASDGNNQKLSVLYFALDRPLVLNSKQLNMETPVASYLKNTFNSVAEATTAVNPISDNGGQKVDLGYGITGYQQGAAGSSYLSWEEGNWNLVVRASNIEGQEPQTLAKQVVEYLEKAALPAPKDNGQITLDMNKADAKANQVVWQDGTVVYTVTHQDAMSALQMAVSMNQ